MTPVDEVLAKFVREPWPSPSTGATLTGGTLRARQVTIHIESVTLVAFGDGIEDDGLTLTRGQLLTIGVAERHLSTGP